VMSAGATYWYLRRQELVVTADTPPAGLADEIAEKVAERLRRP
jgi:hypothetical protein